MDDSSQDTFAAVTLLVAVAQFPRLVFTGARATRYRGAAQRAALKMDIHLNRRIATRVQNLASDDFRDARLHCARYHARHKRGVQQMLRMSAVDKQSFRQACLAVYLINTPDLTSV